MSKFVEFLIWTKLFFINLDKCDLGILLLRQYYLSQLLYFRSGWCDNNYVPHHECTQNAFISV